MMDLERLKGVEVDDLGNEDVDYWCEKMLGFSPNTNESKKNLITLFEFTRSLLNLKLTQNDVLVEELKTLGEKFDALGNEIENIKQTPTEKENELEDELHDERLEKQMLEDKLKQKDHEIGMLKIEVETLRRSRKDLNHDENDENNENDRNDIYDQRNKSQFEQKNAEIEQLLDRIYEADRQNLSLAESLAKSKLENAKLDNQEKIHLSRIDLLELEIKEYKKLNESLYQERQEKNREIEDLKTKLENILQNNNNKDDSYIGLENESNLPPEKRSSLLIRENLYNELKSEIERLTVLLEVKDSQLERAQLTHNKYDYRNQTDVQRELEKKQLEIENLEEELSILSSVNDSSDSSDKQKARILNLKKDKQALLIKIAELEKEAGNKDEELEQFRRRQLGSETYRSLMEENTVLGKMVKTRDEKISYLIEQLNRNGISTNHGIGSSINSNSQVHSETIELEDKVAALSVERDIQDRQIAALGAHLESVQKENFELEAGLREILNALRNSDTTSDVVIECPSLEKLCILMENRLLSSGMQIGNEATEFGKIIILKTELDNVRGQNEQLRAEIKQLRSDFLSVIDGYTNDILENWTVSNLKNISVDGKEQSTTTTKAKNDEEEATLEQISEIRDDRPTQVQDAQTNDEAVQKETEINMEILKKLKAIQARQQSPRRTPRMKLNLKTTKKKVQDSKISQETTQKSEESVKELTKIFEKSDKNVQTDNEEKQIEDQTPEKEMNLESKELQEKNMKLEQNKAQLQKLRKELAEREQELNDLKNILETKKSDSSKEEDKKEMELKETTNSKNQETQTRRIETATLSTQISLDEGSKKQEYSFGKEAKNGKVQDDNDDEYVDMIDNFTQTEPEAAPRQVSAIRRPKFNSISTQTRNIVVEKPKIEECQDCRKYLQSFQTIKSLIQSERQQFNHVNARNQENIDKLKSTLAVTKQEYEFDIQSKNNVISDLREKLKQTETEPQNKSFKKVEKNIQSSLAVVPQENNKQSPENSVKDVSKTILETSISCLRNCLKQKEDALEEYRKLVEDMRITIQKGSGPPGEENLQMTLTNNHDNFGHNLQELMLKPYVQQNDELNALIQKTFQELRLVRESSAKQYHSMKIELESKSKILIELTKKHENDRKEKEHLKKEIKDGLEREKALLAKIEKLNARIIELSKRTLFVRPQQQQNGDTSASSATKNIDYEKLNQQYKDLQNQIKKIELDRWTIEKKLEQDKQHWKQTSEDKEKTINSLGQQLSKSQNLIVKLEKQLRNARINQQKMVSASPKPVLQQSKSVQTETVKTVRFEENIEDRTGDDHNADILKQYEILNQELQRQLEASLKREKFSMVIKEVQAVGENILESTRIDRFDDDDGAEHDSDDDADNNKESADQEYYHEGSGNEDERRDSGTRKKTLESKTKTSSKNKKRYLECYADQTSFLNASEIYDQLIDMQFDRLINENAHLKVQLRLKDECQQFHALLE